MVDQEDRTDDSDALGRLYKLYWLKVQRVGFVLLALVLLSFVFGIPHFQTTYTYYGARPKESSPVAHQKLAAWYFSITGWQHVKSGQYGNKGCPFILWIPVKDCLELNW